MKVLVINAGSSSIKYQLMDVMSGQVLAKGGAERIGLDNALIKHTDSAKKRLPCRWICLITKWPYKLF